MTLMKADMLQAEPARDRLTIIGLVSIVCGAILLAAFSEALLELVHRWGVQEEYSHCYLIAPLAIWLLWRRRRAIVGSIGAPSWSGPALLFVAAVLQVIGKLSALFFVSQLAFIIAILGLVLGLGGYSLLRVVFVPVIFLIFAIPMPYFFEAALSWRLQIVSSQLGVYLIRLFDIPVFLEGNIIDLGAYKLQVVEACSGLRYLYPLTSLAFLAAYLYRARFWQKSIVFLSSIPITVIMNSVRIAVVGILVNSWGPQDADGFLHMFEGWIIFIACAALLVLEMQAMTWAIDRRSFLEVFYTPEVRPVVSRNRAFPRRAPIWISLILVCLVGAGTYFVSTRREVLPYRQSFAGFPFKLGAWTGHRGTMDTSTATFLGVTDYVLGDFSKSDARSVNLYVAYYATQRSGVSPHSPSVCLPGNGWQMTDFKETSYRDPSMGINLPLNRVIMAKGASRELVYYWFEERGITVANEYLSKLYLLRDAAFKNRTDGALVRLITPIFPGEDEAQADRRLEGFIRTLLPNLKRYLPSGNSRLSSHSVADQRSTLKLGAK
jgi:exosortase D (VPLPA-CTERM-specific)